MKHKKTIQQSLLISDLIAGYLAGTLTEVEQATLQAWIEEDPHHKDLFQQLTDVDALKGDVSIFNGFDQDMALGKVKQAIVDTLKHQQRVNVIANQGWWSVQLKKLNRTSFRAAAAILFIGMVLIAYYLKDDNVKEPIANTTTIQDIDGASRGATLTLPNGKKIRLGTASEGQIVQEHGVTITKTADGQLIYELSSIPTNDAEDGNSINVLHTARGETYSVKLPDGSLVHLNSASTLEYPMNFMHSDKRQVKLSGEAFFEVAHQPAKPFIVAYEGQQAEVLGTAFNINAYANDKATVVTLVNGSLRVATEKQASLMRPGDAAIYNGKDLRTVKADVAANIAWKDGKFYFDNSPFDEIATQFSRWYDIDVVYVNNKIPTIKFTGEMRRDVSLQTVLSYFKELGIKFKLQNRKLIIE